MHPPFACLAADPPWRFGNTFTRAAAEGHYATMTEEEIIGLTVNGWTVPQLVPSGHCYLWTTDSHLDSALRVMEAWGFAYKQTLIWVKIKEGRLQIGLGNYYRHAHEICLFGVKGKAPALDKSLPSVFWAPRGKHSAKPEALQDLAEKMSPGPRIELFSRRPREGWYGWGFEASGSVTQRPDPPSGVGVEPGASP